MKKKLTSLILALVLAMPLLSCQDDPQQVVEETLPTEPIAFPSGRIIAEKASDLKDLLRVPIKSRFGRAVDFTINYVDIQYYETDFVLQVNIPYVTLDGYDSNVVLSYYKHKKGGENESSCEVKAYQCYGNNCCQISTTTNTDGSVTNRCGCFGCTLEETTLANPCLQ
ncbi:hypothetical protein AB9P05_12790 [Roseivirga sp. BDSF3-8]|uniref:hypothetical protein n=1 Tax=Roseivirga sp. BDSF3-8 TaxID=3241598 RepID=UPI00353267CF